MIIRKGISNIAKTQAMRISRTIKLFMGGILFIFLVNPVTATEWVPDEPPALTNETAALYEIFWTSIETGNFGNAIETGNTFINLSPNLEHSEIITDSIQLIHKYRFISRGESLSEFLLLERKRIYWQDYSWWPNSILVDEAMEQVLVLIKDYHALLTKKSKNALDAEILYRLGLCYADSGRLGPREYDKAIDIFSKIKKTYSNSELADDASLEFILTKIKSAENRQAPIFSISDAIELIKDFLNNYPKSNREIEARLLLAELLEFKGLYSLAEKEYQKVLDTAEPGSDAASHARHRIKEIVSKYKD